MSQWADKHRVLSQKASAEPGVWRTDRVPYLREIMDCLSVTSPVNRVVFMKGAQVGGSECGNNWIGYVIDHAPGPMLVVMPTSDTAKKNSRQRIAPLIEECARLSEKVSNPSVRDSGNTVLSKDFPGGVLVLTGANSAVGLRSLPARYLFLDEVDGYPIDVDGEGDPIGLAEARSRTFSRRKAFILSTPTIEDRSKIESEFNATDKRYYFVPCPKCNEMQTLQWKGIKWEKSKPLGAWYECEYCNGRIENWQKTKMLESGEWRATQESTNPKVVGFHLSSLYSPVGWLSWGECVEEWVKAQKSRERLRSFVNTILGETWKEKGDSPDWKRLHERRQSYKIGSLPSQVLFLTMGVDVQKDRLELEIVGWGRDKISWSIDYRVIPGGTASIDSAPWKTLRSIIGETFQNEAGVDLPIRMTAIDSGYNTQVVYSFVRKFPQTQVIAVKGRDTLSVIVGMPSAVDINIKGNKFRRGFKLYTIGTNLLKGELYGWLKLDSPDKGEDPPEGFCYFPDYEEEYFKQLTAEHLVTRTVKGYKKYEWEKTRERNEALDTRNYARVAASICGMDRYKSHNWQKLEDETGVKNNRKESPDFPKTAKKVTIKRRKSNYL